MHFEIYQPIIRHNILSHVQNTSPHFTQEPVLAGKIARPGSPIHLTQTQFENLALEIYKLISAESCQAFAVDDQGEKHPITRVMMEELLRDLRDEDDETEDPSVKEEPKAEEPKVEVKPEEPKVEQPVESGPAVEIPAPLTTPATEPTPVVETQAAEAAPAAPTEAPAVEETAKKKGKGKKQE